MKKFLAFLSVVILVIILSSCAAKQSPQEKIARGVPNPEYGSIYLYCNDCINTYEKLIPLPPGSTNFRAILTEANLEKAIFAFIVYDSKDPRDTYNFYHFPLTGTTNLNPNTTYEVMTPQISVFKGPDGNNFYYIELYNTVPGGIYGVKDKHDALFSPFFIQR